MERVIHTQPFMTWLKIFAKRLWLNKLKWITPVLTMITTEWSFYFSATNLITMLELQRFTYSRWILVLPLAVCGAMYLFHFTGMTQISSGVLPGNPGAWAVIAGLSMLIAAGAIATKRFDRFAALGVTLLLTFFTAAVYAPCLGHGSGAMQFSSGFNLFKDMVLAAGSLAYAGLASARM